MSELDKLSRDRLEEISKRLDALKIRFKNAEVAKRTGYSAGNVSVFLNGEKPMSDNFYETFMDKFPLPADGGEHIVNEAQAPYINGGRSLDVLIESNRLLAESQKVFAESQKIFAQSQLNFSESNKRVIDTNAVLADLLHAKATAPGLQSVPLEVLTRLSGLMEYLAELGVETKKWQDKDTALAELNKRFYAPQKSGAVAGNPGA